MGQIGERPPASGSPRAVTRKACGDRTAHITAKGANLIMHFITLDQVAVLGRDSTRYGRGRGG